MDSKWDFDWKLFGTLHTAHLVSSTTLVLAKAESLKLILCVGTSYAAVYIGHVNLTIWDLPFLKWLLWVLIIMEHFVSDVL